MTIEHFVLYSDDHLESRLPELEVTGTWPDYLVNRDDQNNEGPFEETNFTKIEK